MDYYELFNSCRTGDIEKLQYLVEAKDVEVNTRDRWDTTPLYYACLCGHETVVKYLLENGAKCEANTFDGERCLYAALSDQIRKMLRSYKMITSTTMKRDIFDEFLRRLMNDEVYTDTTFRVLDEKFHVHKCVLAARCPPLYEKLKGRIEDKKVIAIKNLKVDPVSFRMILSYIYTGRVQVPYDSIATVLLLAKHCSLTQLTLHLEKQLTQKHSFESSKPGVAVDVLSIDYNTDKQKLKSDLTRLADQAIHYSLISPLTVEMPFPPKAQPICPDICFKVEGFRFKCHRLFFCQRSDYFKTLLEDPFDENSNDPLPVITLSDIPVDVFNVILYYVYTESCELDGVDVFDVLCKADMYLLPGLKRLCASFIGQQLDNDNIFNVLQISRLFSLHKLEDLCTEYIAHNIEEMVSRKEFSDLIVKDAHSINSRQESDSIDIIDSVRFHLANHVQTYSEIEETDSKLALIDELLESLDLDC